MLYPLFIITAGKQDVVTQMPSVGPPCLTQGDVEIAIPVIEKEH